MTTGDGLLVEFASVVDAVRCAVEVQQEMIDRNVTAPARAALPPHSLDKVKGEGKLRIWAH